MIMPPRGGMTTALSLSATPLWQLAAAYAATVEELIDAGGDMSDEDLIARLDAVQMALPLKVGNCALVHRDLETSAQADKAFAQPWIERAVRKLKAADRLKAYTKSCLETAGLDRVESEHGGARIQNNGGKAPVLFDGDPATLPAEFQRVTVELDRDKVLAAHAAGQPLPDGVTIGPRGRALRWL